ncbi:putative ribonuclease H-like domain-containing protein [Tanacetum coccineum]
MEVGTTSTTLNARLPILNPGEYDIWLMRIEQHFLMTDYSLWEVILNGNKVLKRTVGEVEQEYKPTSTEENKEMRSEMKARGTLLMALSNKDQLKFHSYKDAKLLMEAIEKRYEGNKKSKKVQRTLLKQQYENFSRSSSKTMDQTFDRLQKLISQLEIQGEVITQEDMNLKLLRRSTNTIQNSQNVAFVSSNNTNSNSNNNKNEAHNTTYGISAAHTQSNPTSGDNLSDAVICAFLASQPNSPQLAREDLEQIDPDDLEEIDLQWELAMLTIKARRFIKRTGRKLDVNGQRVRFDRGRENSRRTVTVETPTENALVAQDGIGGYNWSYQAEEVHPTNYALMAYTSSGSSSSSDSKVDSCSKSCVKAYATLKEEYDSLSSDYKKYQFNLVSYKAVKSENMDVITVVTPSNVKKVESNHEYADVKNNGDALEPKTVRKNSFRPLVIEDWNSDDDSEVEFIPNVKDKTVRPSTEKINIIKSAREQRKKVETPKQNKHYPRGNQRNLNNLMLKEPVWNNSSRMNHKNFANKMTHPHPNRRFVPQAVLTRSGKINTAGASANTTVRPFNTAGSKTTVNHPRPISNAYKKGYSQVTQPFNKYSTNKNSIFNKKVNNVRVKDTTAKDRVVKTNLLTEYEDYDGGFVSFRDGKGRISGKGVNNGTEFKNSIMNQFCEMKGIKREFSIARTPQQNGVAERKNRTLIEATITTLVDSKFLTTFWAESVNTACYVLKRVLNIKPHNKTPYELIRRRPPLIDFMKPFGCPVTILNTKDHLGKFDEKSDEGYFVGYYVVSKAVRVFNKRTKIVEETLNIRFLENAPNVMERTRYGDHLANNLCTIWVERFKLHANIARFQRSSLKNSNTQFTNKAEKKSVPVVVHKDSELEQGLNLFHIDESHTWVDIEGIPLKIPDFTEYDEEESDTDDEIRDEELHDESACMHNHATVEGESDVEEVFENIFENEQYQAHKKDDLNSKMEGDECLQNIHDEKVASEVKMTCHLSNPKDDKEESICSGHFKKADLPCSGGSMLQLMDDLVKMNFMSLNIQGLAQKGKKDWVKELCVNNKAPNGKTLLIISIYASQELSEKKMLWDYLTIVIDNWNGEVVIMGDFNKVCKQAERYGSIFNVQGADAFNSFILAAGLEEVPLGGCSFTWCHKSATKMSKLDHFLISDGLMGSYPNISMITFDYHLFDHRPILMRESHFDYGPIPFQFFHYWFEMEGFDKFVERTWNEAHMTYSNAMTKLMKKMKYLKDKICAWIKVKKDSSKKYKKTLKAELTEIELLLDQGEGNTDVFNRRMSVSKSLQDIAKLESVKVAQKAKIKWAIKGDENSKYYHGILSKKRSQLAIRGILVDGIWIDSPRLVQSEFLSVSLNFI